MFLLFLLCLCYAVGRAQAAGETIEISVVNGSLSDLRNYEEGDSLTLSCKVTALGTSSDLVVSWQHGADVVSWNGALREPYTGSRFAVVVLTLPGRGDTSRDVVHQLTISPLKPVDDGDYSCLLGRPDLVNPMSYSTVAAEAVTLTVSYFPDETSPMCTPNGPVDVYDGDSILLRCSTEKGNPEVQLTLTNTGGSSLGPWSKIQDSDTISQELLLDGLTSSNTGSVFICTISSSRFPSDTRSCGLGPLNVVQRPIMVSPTTVNSRRPGDPIGPQSTTIAPTSAPDPACRGWLIAFIASAAVATLSIIFNVVFLTMRQMKTDRKTDKKEKERQNEMILLDDMTKKNGTATAEDVAKVNVAVSED